LPCCLPSGKAGGLQILCCQGFAVYEYSFTLDALALKLSDFCNIKVYIAVMSTQKLILVIDWDILQI